MKNVNLFIILIVLILTSNSSFCQQDIRDKQIIQLETGKVKITFKVFDYETNEPLIGAAIYSFNLKKILATTDIYGIAITEKALEGNLEVSYIAYYSECFKLNNTNIDNVKLWLKAAPLNLEEWIDDPTTNSDSLTQEGESDAMLDLKKGNIRILTTVEPSEEQNLFAKNNSFEFKVYEGNNYYREAYNEVVIDFLNKKFEKNIEEELREICWRIYQP